MPHSIGDFSKVIGIPTSTLRYYENEGLLKPDRDENNLRVYTEEDLRWTTFLLHLKGTGIAIPLPVKTYAGKEEVHKKLPLQT